MITRTKEKGFVILFTVLIASIVLAIALGIASVSFREVLLSSTARDGEYAFFAADTGAECALYWDIREGAFGETLVTPECRGNEVEMLATSPVRFRFDTNIAGCAVVTVDKSDPTVTKIESLGYNVACQTLDISPLPARVVERAIRVTYGPGEAPDANPNEPTGGNPTGGGPTGGNPTGGGGDTTTRGGDDTTISDSPVVEPSSVTTRS